MYEVTRKIIKNALNFTGGSRAEYTKSNIHETPSLYMSVYTYYTSSRILRVCNKRPPLLHRKNTVGLYFQRFDDESDARLYYNGVLRREGYAFAKVEEVRSSEANCSLKQLFNSLFEEQLLLVPYNIFLRNCQ